MPSSRTSNRTSPPSLAADIHTWPSGLPYLNPFSTRFRSSLASSDGSASTVKPLGTSKTRRLGSQASSPQRERSSLSRLTRSSRTGSVPCSSRVMLISWEISWDILSAWRWIMAMVSCRSSPVSSYLSAYSQAPVIMDTGVRSSCEASAVNCFSDSKDRSSRWSSWSKAAASWENSSFPGGSPMRRDRSWASLIDAAVAVMLSKGRNALFAIR